MAPVTDTVPRDTVLTDTILTDTVAPETLLTGTVGTDTVAPETLLTGTVGADTVASESPLRDTVAAALAALAALPASGSAYSAMPDAELLGLQSTFGQLRRHLDASAAFAANELAYRSRRELGYQGLAQRSGHRTPEALVQHLTGSTGQEATTLVRVGRVMRDAEAATELRQTPDAPGASSVEDLWLVEVGRAAAEGTISIAAADAIRRGLGTPTETVPTDVLREAASALVEVAVKLNADALFRRARAARDELDIEGIAGRQAAMRDQRYLRIYPRSDGMVRIDGLLDPESAAEITDAFDQVTSPRRGGPRFVDPAEKERAERLVNDPRTTEQIMVDALVGMVRIAGEADPGTIFGSRRPGVRVLVTLKELEQRTGSGRIEGQAEPVSMETVERFACDAGIIPLVLDDDGRCLKMGRRQRFFTANQRIALSSRDGGCLWGECSRPPAMCEAHHIDEWHRDDGETDVDDGVLLCRHHHMLLHDNHWRIFREGGAYFLVPPATEDPEQRPIPMPSKSGALKDLMRRGAGSTG